MRCTSKILGAWIVTMALLSGIANAGPERDPLVPRVPVDQRAAAKLLNSPLYERAANAPAGIVAEGKALYEGKGTCINCHGINGDGKGPAGAVLNPGARNFTNCTFHKKRKDGELMWIIKNGSPGTGMVPLIPATISEEEAWKIIAYERSFCNDFSQGNEGSRTLQVTNTGSGIGTVTSTPTGISCGNNCLETYPKNAIVTLVSIPVSGSTFVGWRGGDCSGTGDCTVTLTDNMTVTATFDYVPPVTTSRTGSIRGNVLFSGSVPPPKEYSLSKFPNAKFCQKNANISVDGTTRLLKEVEVDSRSRGLKNVVVSIRNINDQLWTSTFERAPAQEVIIDHCEYLPYTGVAVRNGRFKVVNNDADPSDPKSAEGVLHNVHSFDQLGAKSSTEFNIGLARKGDSLEKNVKLKMSQKGSMLRLQCDQHEFEQAWFLPVTNPFYGKTNNEGAFEIHHVPAGTHQLMAWHPIAGQIVANVTVKEGEIATANFQLGNQENKIPKHLQVTMAGNGRGTVTSNPAGIICGTDCSEWYSSGTAVLLTPTASPGSIFSGWSGGSCSRTSPCTVTMMSDTTVTATFSLLPPQPSSQVTLQVITKGAGSGTVTSNPAGISCGTDCSESYASGTVMTLFASSKRGSLFLGWSGGGCSGTDPCVLTPTTNTIVSATFTTPSLTKTRNDLDGNGTADLLWRNTKNGSTAIWLLNETGVATSGFPGGVPPAWHIAGSGDVNGDGKADVIWRHSTSATVAIWLMNGATITSVGFPANVPTAWSLEAVEDVNGDGQADLLWRNTTDGNTAIWLMNGTRIAASSFLGKVPLAWQIAGMGDANADGKADIIWRNGTSNGVAVWLMNGMSILSVGFPGSASPGFQITGVGDVNGDGKVDLVWRNTSTGDVTVWLLNGPTIASTGSLGGLPSQWQIAQVGDANGDGKADVFWHNNVSGQVAVWRMNGLSIAATAYPGRTSTDWQIQ
ncbi:FG-GAP-like repeat-containing protein [Nitrospira sp. Ecomares 2.1]